MNDNDLIVNEGLGYLKSLHRINPQKPKLSPEVLYNLICMGIESVLTGVLMKNNSMVNHGGILQLVRELSKIETVELDWIQKARFMNKFQTYCALEPIEPKIPNATDLEVMINFGKDIETYGKKQITF